MPGVRAIAGLAVVVAAAATFGDLAYAQREAENGTGAIAGTVRREGATGEPSGVVIVYVVGFEEPPPSAPAVIHQVGKRFVPALLAITAGQRVSFPNEDPFFHNVFSPSPARLFDLGQYPKGETKTKRFPSIGIVEVFCNIHPEMAATVLVLPNRRFARAGGSGAFRIEGVPPGRWTVYAFSRRAISPAKAPVEVAGGKTTAVNLTLGEVREDPSHLNKYGERYRDPVIYP